MSKFKKKLRKNIYPEKSNKMIYAVLAGLLILFAAIFFLSTRDTLPENRKDAMESTLAYLKKTEGISNLVFEAAENRVKIYYIQDSKESKKTDYKRITLFAGMKLSNKLRDKNIRFDLINDLNKETRLIIIFKNGSVIEKQLEK